MGRTRVRRADDGLVAPMECRSSGFWRHISDKRQESVPVFLTREGKREPSRR